MIDYKTRLADGIASSNRNMSDSIAISAAETALAMDIKDNRCIHSIWFNCKTYG